MTSNPLIFAKQLDGKGSCQNFQSLENLQNIQGPLWLHFDANAPGIDALLDESFSDIDDHTIKAILDQDARPRILELDQGLLIILRGINHNEGAEPEDMVAIRLWVTETRLISLRYRKSKTVMTVAKTLDEGRGAHSLGEILPKFVIR